MDILELAQHNPGMQVQMDEHGRQVVYGVWIPEEGTEPAFWLVLPSGVVFHTTHFAVAQAQCTNARAHWPNVVAKRMVAE